MSMLLCNKLFTPYKIFIIFLSKLEQPVHAPSKMDPWEIEYPEDKNYTIKPVNGVFHVYESQEKADKDESINYPYYDLANFVGDMNLLCAMIADGPL